MYENRGTNSRYSQQRHLVSVANCIRGRCCSIEKWKPVVGFEGYYEVSDLGRVRSIGREYVDAVGVKRHYKGKILSLIDEGRGYHSVMLSAKGRKCHFRVCRAVAQAWIPNPNNYPQVNHKDENKGNNRVSNLEWCTENYNTNYGTCLERRAASRSKPVAQYDLNMRLIRVWPSIKSAEATLGIDNSHITRCCRGKLSKTGGYIWRYAES